MDTHSDTMDRISETEIEDDEEVDMGHLTNKLVKAIESLERTINLHCNLLLRNSISQHQPRMRTNSVISTMDNMMVNESVIGKAKAVRTTVFIRVVFLKIGEIDTLKEKYAADVFVQARWCDPDLDGRTELDPETIDWEQYWNPNLFIENLYGEAKETIWHTLTFDEQGCATVMEKRRVNGTFLEYLELETFPFDTQDLTITVSTERGEFEVDLEEDHSDISGINVQSFVDEQEWRLHNHIETWKKVTTKVFQNAKYKHPALSAACKASRRPGFFIWNIFFVMLFICSLAFATFSVDTKLPQNRLQLSFILLLTTITFKFVVNQNLPRISYLTYLDKYILTSMFILCLVCVWHAVVPLLHTDDHPHRATLADRIALGLLSFTYVFFHIFFFGWIYVYQSKRKWKIFRKDEEHKEKMTLMEKNLSDNKLSDRWNNKVEPAHNYGNIT